MRLSEKRKTDYREVWEQKGYPDGCAFCGTIKVLPSDSRQYVCSSCDWLVKHEKEPGFGKKIWHHYYPMCIRCGRKDRRYFTRGLCIYCWSSLSCRAVELDIIILNNWVKTGGCLICGTFRRKHQARGLCERCYRREQKRALLAKKAKNKIIRWSKEYDACTVCGTTEIIHEGRGLCRSCYSKEKNKEKKIRELIEEREWRHL